MIDHLSKVLITVACSDGEIAPQERESLVQIYEKLGIQVTQVDSDIEACFEGKLNLKSNSRKPKPDSNDEDNPKEEVEPLEINSIIITKALSDALSSICADQTDTSLIQVFEKPTLPEPEPQKDLDPTLVEFLREIAGQTSISRLEFFTIGVRHKLMGDRIIQKVNAWAAAHNMAPILEDGTSIVKIDNVRLNRVISS